MTCRRDRTKRHRRLEQAPDPVPAEDAVAVMALLELGVQSAERGYELAVDPRAAAGREAPIRRWAAVPG
jgi:hypothetical protein